MKDELIDIIIEAEIKMNRVVLGIVYNPITDDLFYANSQTSSLLNGHRINSSSRINISDLFTIFGFCANSKNIKCSLLR